MSLAVESSRAPAAADRFAAAALVAWAAGTVLAEPIAQVGAYALLLAALLRPGSLRLDRDVRRFSAAALLLAVWQAVSPALARWAGSSPGWPRSGRYGQLFDTIAPALAASASRAAPWVALAWVVCVGWALSGALGLYQHFVRWPFEQPGWFRTPVDRVRESFSVDGPPRYGAGGFLFHRLRFAHGAVAALGPALALALRTRKARIAVAAAATCAFLLAATYLSYARAAFAVASALTLSALALRKSGRRVAIVLAAAIAIAVLASSDWRTRLVRGGHNLLGEGERRLSMEVAWDLVRRHPLLGVGFGNYEEAAWATRQATGVTPLLAIDAHNLWLTTWAETGLFGLLLTIAYHAVLGQALWRRMRQGSWAAAGGLLSLAGFHLLSLVHYLQHHTGVYLSFALAWGLGLAPFDSTSAPALGLAAPPGSAEKQAPEPAPSERKVAGSDLQSVGCTSRAAAGSRGMAGGTRP
jgi:O-antigen ligase